MTTEKNYETEVLEQFEKQKVAFQSTETNPVWFECESEDCQCSGRIREGNLVTALVTKTEAGDWVVTNTCCNSGNIQPIYEREQSGRLNDSVVVIIEGTVQPGPNNLMQCDDAGTERPDISSPKVWDIYTPKQVQ